MADEEEGPDDKPFEATPKRLEEARKKGDVPHSMDVTGACAMGGFLLAIYGIGSSGLLDLGATLSILLDRSHTISGSWFQGPIMHASAGLLLAIAAPLAIWLGVPAGAALLSIVSQQAFVISAERIKPKLSRISPIEGAKNKFGRNGLFEFSKSFVKLIIYSVTLGVFIYIELPDMMISMQHSAEQVVSLMLLSAARFLFIVFLITMSIGAIDFFWQRAEHLRKNRMSRKEMTDEQKESEGDPYLKGRRREKGVEIATNRMLADVPKADVVVVNPTHFAVALKWNRESGSAPICVAKGVDEVAAQIRRTAEEAGVPVRRDPPTARILHRMLEIGQEIQPEHYRAVAVAIRFADRIRGRARPQ
jgi:flagellar biosynthetic protein FlhB